ncbi:hypothetical protein [Acinetobacter phage BUCT628]|nr:hypothetical protein [Acinetobacter phage BUCT628]
MARRCGSGAMQSIKNDGNMIFKIVSICVLFFALGYICGLIGI